MYGTSHGGKDGHDMGSTIQERSGPEQEMSGSVLVFFAEHFAFFIDSHFLEERGKGTGVGGGG